MKVWASASAIGLSATYLVTACSGTPAGDDNSYQATTAGAPTTAGNNTGTAGNGTGGSGNGAGGNAPTGGAGTTGGVGPGVTVGGGDGVEKEIACPANVQGHCSMGATYPTYPGYTLALVEDFPAPLDLDKDPVMTWSDGSPADGQTGFRKDQIGFAGGKMTISAEAPCAPKTTNAGCIAPRMSYGEALSPATQNNVGAMGVWSGELRSRYNNYRYGRYEVKFAAPIANPGQEGTDNRSGNYLSTMFVFRTPKNVKWNEIDVELEPWHHNHVAGNVVNATGATAYPAGNAFAWDVAAPGNYAITQEHVYAFNWTPTKIEWFVDGTSIKDFAGSASDPIPTLSAKIMMNLWVFSGNTFGEGVNNKLPFKSSYDYFHFYKLDTETTYPCSPVPTCLPADDKTKSAQNNPAEANYGM